MRAGEDHTQIVLLDVKHWICWYRTQVESRPGYPAIGSAEDSDVGTDQDRLARRVVTID